MTEEGGRTGRKGEGMGGREGGREGRKERKMADE